MHGPFWHKLNKGGLDAIVRTQQMLSTTSRFGSDAVRAHVGAYDKDQLFKLAGNEIVIEFHTTLPPRSGTPPWLAEWPMPMGTYLPIKLDKVYQGGIEQKFAINS